MNDIRKEFEQANNVKEMFEVVKESVKLTLNESRAGIDLGLVDMGNGPGNLVSAFYPVGSNIIIVNKTPLRRISQTKPELMKPYMFVVLLHEYLHSLGYMDEATVRKLTHKITGEIFNVSVITDMASDLTKYFPFLLFPGGRPASNEMQVIELDNVDYIG